MNLPTYIQKAAELGLLTVEEGKVTDCNKEAVETVLGTARIIEKLQPTTAAEVEDTTDQEAIVLCRVLNAPSGLARELWSELRVAFGVAHDQTVPLNLWSTPEFKAVGSEIDRTYLGERNTQLITREALISNYESLQNASRTVSFQDFAMVVGELTRDDAMGAYGNAESEWAVALDLLRQQRVKALYHETFQTVEQIKKADTKLEKTIEFQQQRLMECLGMLRGSVGQQGNAKSATDILYGVNGQSGMLDSILLAKEQTQPISTGIPAMDLDMEGGVYPPGAEFTGGRLFTLAARTGVGKTILGANAAVSLAAGGLKVGFVSAELDENEIWTRVWACATRVFNDNTDWASVGDIKQPGVYKEKIAARVQQACGGLQNAGGEILVEAPWGADVEAVVNILRSMKAKNPELRVAVIDHFHCLARHRGAPHSEAAMMEERAYKLMTVAKELGIDLIVLAQMNRVGMDVLSSKAAPGLDQIRGTDALSHVSHAVWIVRKEAGNDDQPNVDRDLEFWHAKVRGRQAYWTGSAMKSAGSFVECSKLTMDYPHSCVKTDNTLSQAAASR
jgi:KaiC/GvpD/RAD55 family RecA-like ATPase